MTRVTFDITDELAKKADSYGLLNSKTIAELLDRKARQCAAAEFCKMASEMHQVTPPFTEDEIVDICRQARNGELE